MARWIVLLLAVACRAPAAPLDAGADAGDPIDVLVFSRTAAFRHTSIEPAVGALRAIAGARGWRLEHIEDPARFDAGELARFDVVVFLSTSGDVLDDAQQAALEGFVRAGGGFVGVHSASDTEYEWPWYGRLVGAYFARHPAAQRARLHVEVHDHPSTARLPDPWTRVDEWYDFRSSPRPDAVVLLTLDEASYEGGTMGADHPIAWHRELDGGRSFYTGLGHTADSWSEPAFLDHVSGGIEWAAGRP